MKHAFLIIAHNDFTVLKALLTLLDDERNDIYVHIDRRADELYEKVSTLKLSRAMLWVVSERMNVYWGDISQVMVEYLLMQVATSHAPHAYYHLLSGVDLPIKPQDEIHDFFHRHAGKEFVSYWLDEGNQKNVRKRVSRYYLFTRSLKRNHSKWHWIAAPVRNLCLALQKATGYRRPMDLEFRKGDNWFSITQEACMYLLSKRKWALTRLKYTLCPDETFVQTLLWNSPFRDKLYDTADPNTGCMRKIDWKRGHPYVWTASDFEELCHSKELFARKFSSDDTRFIHQLLVTYEPNSHTAQP